MFQQFRTRARAYLLSGSSPVKDSLRIESDDESDVFSASLFGVTVAFVFQPAYDSDGSFLRGLVRCFRVATNPFDSAEQIGEFTFNPRSGQTDLPMVFNETTGLVDHADSIVLGFLDAAIPRANVAT